MNWTTEDQLLLRTCDELPKCKGKSAQANDPASCASGTCQHALGCDVGVRQTLHVMLYSSIGHFSTEARRLRELNQWNEVAPHVANHDSLLASVRGIVSHFRETGDCCAAVDKLAGYSEQVREHIAQVATAREKIVSAASSTPEEAIEMPYMLPMRPDYGSVELSQ